MCSQDEEPDGARESESYVEGDDVVDDAAPRPAARQDAIAARPVQNPFCVSFCAARTLNTIAPSRVTLLLR